MTGPSARTPKARTATAQPGAGATFAGIFKPPVFGPDQKPLPIAGPGEIRCDEAGLTVTGFTPQRQTGRMVVYLLSLVSASVALTAIRTFAFPNSPLWIVGVVAGLFGVIAYGMLMGKGEHDDTPITWTFPWANVRRARPDPQNSKLVAVTIHKQTPDGLIHFEPRDGVARVLAALEGWDVAR